MEEMKYFLYKLLGVCFGTFLIYGLLHTLEEPLRKLLKEPKESWAAVVILIVLSFILTLCVVFLYH